MQYKKTIAGTPVTFLFDPPIFIFPDWVPIQEIALIVNRAPQRLPAGFIAEIAPILPLSTSLHFRNFIFDNWQKFEASPADYKQKFFTEVARERAGYLARFHDEIASMAAIDILKKYPPICFMTVTEYLRSYCDF